jgi:hypothetical protein
MTNTQTRYDQGERDAEPPRPPPDSTRPNRGRTAAVIAVTTIAIVVIVAAVLALNGGADDGTETADVPGQGNSGPVLATDGARLERRADGLVATMDVPTPEPGSYEYPTGDMVPPWASPHPPVSPGATNAPEVFTLWLVVFNDPAACTNDSCDADDFAADAAARGGIYQLDGRIADDTTMSFVGSIRVGEQPETGSPLDNPTGADVHLAIAPHGRTLPGTDGWSQLNGPVGNPTLWWTAEFPSQQ